MSAETGLEAAVKDAYADVIAWQREAREALWRAPSHRQVEATIRAQYDRAEAAEAKLAAIEELCSEPLRARGVRPGTTGIIEEKYLRVEDILAIIGSDEEVRDG